MGVSDGHVRWVCQMGASDGCVRWACQMGVSDVVCVLLQSGSLRWHPARPGHQHNERCVSHDLMYLALDTWLIHNSPDPLPCPAPAGILPLCGVQLDKDEDGIGEYIHHPMFSLPLKLGVVAMVMGYVIVVHRCVSALDFQSVLRGDQ